MDLPIQSIDSLRDAGRAAAENGEDRDTNPYPRYGSHYRQWEHGHVWEQMGPLGLVMLFAGQEGGQ